MFFIFWQCSLAIGLQFTQKHCSILCQLTIGPYKAKTSILSVMQECSKLGGCRNCLIDFKVILNGSSKNYGGHCGMRKLNIFLSLLASIMLSLPKNSFFTKLFPYFALKLYGLFFFACYGSAGPIIFFQKAIGSPSFLSGLQRSMTQHYPLRR